MRHGVLRYYKHGVRDSEKKRKEKRKTTASPQTLSSAISPSADITLFWYSAHAFVPKNEILRLPSFFAVAFVCIFIFSTLSRIFFLLFIVYTRQLSVLRSILSPSRPPDDRGGGIVARTTTTLRLVYLFSIHTQASSSVFGILITAYS